LKKNKFLEEFPIALDMIHRALRAGHSSERALEMVAARSTGPLGGVFQQISDKIRLGEPPEIVLAEMSNRIGIDEFRMLSIVLVLQRETGGSLAESVENFSKIIVVSHLPTMKDQFPVQFFIQKGVQGSTVSVIEQG